MIIEIDGTVVKEAQANNQLAFDVLGYIAKAQMQKNHIIWANHIVLDDIISLSPKLGNDVRAYLGAKRYITSGKKIYDSLYPHACVTFDKQTMRVSDKLIYINPTDLFSFDKTILLGENLNDCNFFEYIANWYIQRDQSLKSLVSCKSLHIQGSGDQLADSYENYATTNNDVFCLCIADSDLKFDVNMLTGAGLLKGQTVRKGKTISKVLSFDNKNKPFNCTCYCFESAMEIENLIPFSIIANDGIYKAKITTLHNPSKLAFFDFKIGLKKSNLEKFVKDPKEMRLICLKKQYWELMLPELQNSTFPNDTIIEGFGDKLLSTILRKHAKELSTITDNMLTDYQKYEYNEIGKRIAGWCCGLCNLPPISIQ